MITIKHYPSEIKSLDEYLQKMYDITADNMYSLLEISIPKEEDFKLWSDSISNNLKNNNIKWILAFDKEELCGYTMYRTSDDFVVLDEIEIDKQHQGDKITFYELMLGIMNNKDLNNIETLYAFSNKKNLKSQGILKSMGFSMIEEKTNSYKFKGNKKDTTLWLNQKYNK